MGESVGDVVDVRAPLKWGIHHDAVELPEVIERQEVGAATLLNHPRDSGGQLGVDLDGGDVGIAEGECVDRPSKGG